MYQYTSKLVGGLSIVITGDAQVRYFYNRQPITQLQAVQLMAPHIAPHLPRIAQVQRSAQTEGAPFFGITGISIVDPRHTPNLGIHNENLDVIWNPSQGF